VAGRVGGWLPRRRMRLVGRRPMCPPSTGELINEDGVVTGTGDGDLEIPSMDHDSEVAKLEVVVTPCSDGGDADRRLAAYVPPDRAVGAPCPAVLLRVGLSCHVLAPAGLHFPLGAQAEPCMRPSGPLAPTPMSPPLPRYFRRYGVPSLRKVLQRFISELRDQ
jgi:hypothetical protein